MSIVISTIQHDKSLWVSPFYYLILVIATLLPLSGMLAATCVCTAVIKCVNLCHHAGLSSLAVTAAIYLFIKVIQFVIDLLK